jgi:hypothetical protein
MLLVLALAAGCAPFYAYEPEAGVEYSGYDGRIAAEAPLPGGEVRVVAMGMAAVMVPDQLSKFRALHVRLVLDNKGAAPWLVRPNEQAAEIDSWGRLLPVDASIGSARVRNVVVPPQRKVAVDLFYQVPVPDYGVDLPTGFTMDWKVHTADGTVAANTRFDRHRLDAQQAANRLNRL